jgi:hypothetical protein
VFAKLGAILFRLGKADLISSAGIEEIGRAGVDEEEAGGERSLLFRFLISLSLLLDLERCFDFFEDLLKLEKKLIKNN